MILALETIVETENSGGSNRAGSTCQQHPSRLDTSQMGGLQVNRARTWNWVHRFQLALKITGTELPSLALFVLQNQTTIRLDPHLYHLPKRYELKNPNDSSWIEHQLEDGRKWYELHGQ